MKKLENSQTNPVAIKFSVLKSNKATTKRSRLNLAEIEQTLTSSREALKVELSSGTDPKKLSGLAVNVNFELGSSPTLRLPVLVLHSPC